jgi:endonuclease/exonuclease/phosphatase family metal-dependent hydrolase
MYKILNWNTGLTESEEYYCEIVHFVRSFLEGENTIAVLQQIPYKIKDTDGSWVLSKAYIKFISDFPMEKYHISSNNEYNKGHIVMHTVILSKNKILPIKDKNVYPNGNPTNREAAIMVENKFSLLGLHARTKNDNLSYIKSINGNADIIVGDFNAGDYLEYEYWKHFRDILPTHICVCNLPTKRVENYSGELIRETCIDHVYIKREIINQCCDVVVHNDIKWSDHYPITFSIKSFNESE